MFCAVAVLSGCGADECADAPVVSVADAVAERPVGLRRVEGHLLARGRVARLCSELSEGSPPRCVGPSLMVPSVNPDGYEEAQRAGRYTWTNEKIRLLGRIRGRELEGFGCD